MILWAKAIANKAKELYRDHPALPLSHPHGKFPWWFPKPMFFLTLLAYGVIIILFAIATAGYQLVPIITTSWDDTNSFWFNAFIPQSYRTKTRICGAHTFRVGDSQSPLEILLLTLGISTANPLSFFYNLTDFLDTREGIPLDELVYENAEFINCSIVSFFITQYQAAFQQEVSNPNMTANSHSARL